MAVVWGLRGPRRSPHPRFVPERASSPVAGRAEMVDAGKIRAVSQGNPFASR